MSRYVVTRLEGDLSARGGGTGRPIGLSCHVVDTLGAQLLIASYRTESFMNMGAARAREHVGRLARDHAARLNAS